ncbi:MAG: DNA polymerase, partial [Clostridia bacterium]|nr:DNA polymerase [Clostridia bacterium]
LAYLSYNLATIDRNCDIEVDLKDCVAPVRYGADVKKLFKEFEFNSFLGLDIFTEDAKSEQDERNYPEKIACKTFSDIESALKANLFSAEIEDASAEIYVDGKEFRLDICENGIEREEYLKILREIFANRYNTVVVFSSKQVMHVMKNFGIECNCRFEDVSLLKYLCDFNAINLDLKGLCEYYLYDFEYSAYALSSLYNKYRQMLAEDKIESLYEDIEKPLAAVLFEMEREGVKLSLDVLNELSERYEEIIAEYKKKIFEKCGCEFNLNSPAQLGDVLYNKLGLTAVKKKTGKYSTSADVLEKLKGDNPVIDDI